MTPDVRDLVMSRFNHSKNVYTSMFMRTARWYNLYRGWHSGAHQAFRNDVSIPLLFSTVWTDVARKINISFGVWPYVSMFGYGPEDTAIARKNELLLSAQMRDIHILSKAADMFLCADLYGTAICQTGWLHKEEFLKKRAPIEGASLMGKREKTITEKVTQFDGPNFEVVDMIDFFPQPNVRTIEEMDWVIRRYYLDMDELDFMSKPISEGGPEVFDRNAFLRLKEKGLRVEVDREMDARRGMLRGPFAEPEAKKMEKYAKPVELLEMWGTIPSEFLTDGMATQRVITIAGRTEVLRNAPNPFWHGKKPFIAYSPLKDPHFFHGIGKMEIGEKLQLTINRIANQKLDALDIFIDPVFAYDRSKGVETRNLYMRSGKLVGVDGNPAEALMPIVPDLRQIQQAYGEIEQLKRFLEQGTGLTEGLQTEGGGSSRTTAREFLARQENVSVRLLLESRFAEEGFIEPVADTFRSLNQQFLETPRELKILGINALINPITGEQIPPEVIPITLEDINKDYDVVARGATQTLGKAARQQNSVLLLQALQANPMAMQLVNWQAFIRDLFQTFEMDNVDELLQPTPAQQMALQQIQGGQLPMGAPPPSGAPGFPQPGVGGLPIDPMQLLAMGGEAQQGSLEGTLSGS